MAGTMKLLDEYLEGTHLLKKHQAGSAANLTSKESILPANNTTAEVQQEEAKYRLIMS